MKEEYNMKKKAEVKVESLKQLNEVTYEVKILTTEGIKTYPVPYYVVNPELKIVKGILVYEVRTFQEIVLQGRNQEFTFSISTLPNED